jgi:hypothetical protein
MILSINIVKELRDIMFITSHNGFYLSIESAGHKSYHSQAAGKNLIKNRYRHIMNPDYCSCNDFEKAVEYNDIHYFRPEDDRFNAIKRQVGIFSIWVTSVLLLI